MIKRDMVIAALLLLTAGWIWMRPVEKKDATQKLNLASLVPAEFGSWKSVTHETSEYADRWQSINELLARSYFWPKGPRLDFILEYSSDMRRNFSLHFPENCHKAGGNEVAFLPELMLPLAGGKRQSAKALQVVGQDKALLKHDKLVVYWLVVDGKVTHDSLKIKLNQALAGALQQTRRGFLVRVDYSENGKFDEYSLERGRRVIERFWLDLSKVLPEESQRLILGE